jgi:hypothetical protein
MKLVLVTFVLTVVLPLLISVRGDVQVATARLTHTHTEFSFTVDAPFEQVVPLFGAHEERKWAEGWDPQFVYPTPANDQQGEVFKIAHGQHTSVWINTALDLANGHIQYAHVLGDAMATLIDIHATSQGLQKTAVTVVYERTALVPEANEHVQHFAKADGNGGKEWGEAMNAYFAKSSRQLPEK